MAINSTHKKNSNTAGKNNPLKKDGYAKGGVHSSMIGSKLGNPYSGPPVVKGKHV